MANLKELRLAAQELADVMNLVPDANTPESRYDFAPMSQEDIKAWLQEAVQQIDRSVDVFTDGTEQIVLEFGGPPAPAGASPVNIIDDGDAPQMDDTDAELKDQIGAAETIKDLRIIAREYEQYKSIRGKLASYKDVEELRSLMFEILAPEPIVDTSQSVDELAKTKPFIPNTPKFIAPPVNPPLNEKKHFGPLKKARGMHYTRIKAAAEIFKSNPQLSIKEAAQKADELYMKKTGLGSNPVQAYTQCFRAYEVLTAFGAIE